MPERIVSAVSQGDFFAVAVLPVSDDSARNLNFFHYTNGRFLDELGNEFIVEPFDHRRKNTLEEVSQTEHIQLVNEGVRAIQEGQFKKVVLSRIKKVERASLEVIPTWENLIKAYPQAFVYLLNHPVWGMWMGATPERLVVHAQSKWHTVSLAGTQVNTGEELTWGEKENREQAVVTEFIVEELMAAGARYIEEEGPYTFAAGPVAHLKTDIRFNGDFTLESILHALHPTPAVCGMPRKEAMQFIFEHEKHDRMLYSGPIGIRSPLGLHRVFVNLRCMRVTESQFQLFVGGGIMHNSNASAEWEETENKAKTLLSQLAR